jgi:hypothetical protein
MLKYEGKFIVGQTIRSYDFFGRRDCYVEGVVEDVKSFDLGHAAYKVKCTRRLSGGEEMPQCIGLVYYPPHEVFGFGEYDGRLEAVHSAEMEALILHMTACGWRLKDGKPTHPLGTMQCEDWMTAVRRCVEFASDEA